MLCFSLTSNLFNFSLLYQIVSIVCRKIVFAWYPLQSFTFTEGSSSSVRKHTAQNTLSNTFIWGQKYLLKTKQILLKIPRSVMYFPLIIEQHRAVDRVWKRGKITGLSVGNDKQKCAGVVHQMTFPMWVTIHQYSVSSLTQGSLMCPICHVSIKE